MQQQEHGPWNHPQEDWLAEQGGSSAGGGSSSGGCSSGLRNGLSLTEMVNCWFGKELSSPFSPSYFSSGTAEEEEVELLPVDAIDPKVVVRGGSRAGHEATVLLDSISNIREEWMSPSLVAALKATEQRKEHGDSSATDPIASSYKKESPVEEAAQERTSKKQKTKDKGKERLRWRKTNGEPLQKKVDKHRHDSDFFLALRQALLASLALEENLTPTTANSTKEKMDQEESGEKEEKQKERDDLLRKEVERSSSQLVATQRHYEALRPEDVLRQYREIIAHVVQRLNLPNDTVAVSLLRSFGWNKDRLVEAYVEDSKGVCRSAGITTVSLEAVIVNKEDEFECLVCMDDFKAADSFALPCEHRYCASCWRSFLELKIKEGAGCLSTKCMAPECEYAVHDAAFAKIVSPEAYKTYSTFLIKSFVEDNSLVKWCPAPGCSCCIRLTAQRHNIPVQCLCGFSFCAECCSYGIGDHSPATCVQVKQWEELKQHLQAELSWLLRNINKCPQCSQSLCTNSISMRTLCNASTNGCGYDFCWLCRESWSEHDNSDRYGCNDYGSQLQNEGFGRRLEDIRRFLFYFHRVTAQQKALANAQDQYKCISDRATLLQSLFQLEETEFLHKAAAQICQNRKLLLWSYVMGYYLQCETMTTTETTKKSKQQCLVELQMFEAMQDIVERHTNKLCDLLAEQVEAQQPGLQYARQWASAIRNLTDACICFYSSLFLVFCC
ncbi:RBR-type E3 ubiquitin transferase [Balamuthia mandrillaris]